MLRRAYRSLFARSQIYAASKPLRNRLPPLGDDSSVVAESFVVYVVFTSRFPGGNDFFVRWLGGRELLFNGTNPFDQSVAEEAQRAMFGRLTTPQDKDEAYFKQIQFRVSVLYNTHYYTICCVGIN